MMDQGLLVARLVFGAVMAAHGTQKLFGWFGGHGVAGTGAFFESVGFRPGRLMAAAAGAGEIASGSLVAVGLLGPFGPAMMLAVMISASSLHWHNGLFALSNGVELPLLYATAAVAIALAGHGAYSVDALLGISGSWTASAVYAALAAGVVAGTVNVALRRVPAQNAAVAA